MKIGIDGRVLIKPGSGIVRFSNEIIQELILNHKENEYLIFVNSKSNYKPKIKFKGNYTIKEVPLHPLLWRSKVFTNMLDREKIDIFYSTYPETSHVSSSERNVRLVSTCHGIIPEGMWPNLKEELWCKLQLHGMAKYSDHIVCVSEDTRQAIHKKYKRPSNTISVCYFGLNKNMKPLSPKAKAKAQKHLSKKYGIDAKAEFIFQVAGPQAYKNVDTILKAMDILKEEHKLNIPLVIARVNPTTVNPRAYIDVSKNITYIPWIDFEDIPLFYACAKMNIYSSLFEGVGFPIAEAFACGSPVIASNASALPECAGRAALLVDEPECAPCWANAVCSLYKDKRLQRKLVALGLKRAKAFTWEKVAASVNASFNKAIKGKRIGNRFI